MRRRNRTLGVLIVTALTLGFTIAVPPAGAASVPGAPPKPTASSGNAVGARHVGRARESRVADQPVHGHGVRRHEGEGHAPVQEHGKVAGGHRSSERREVHVQGPGAQQGRLREVLRRLGAAACRRAARAGQAAGDARQRDGARQLARAERQRRGHHRLRGDAVPRRGRGRRRAPSTPRRWRRTSPGSRTRRRTPSVSPRRTRVGSVRARSRRSRQYRRSRPRCER